MAFSAMIPQVAKGQTVVATKVNDKVLPVVDVEGMNAVVMLNDTRTVISQTSFSLVPVENYTDGAIRIRASDAAVGQDYQSASGNFYFRFVAEIEAERDFEDCFALFMIMPDDGPSTTVLREIPDINAIDPDPIQLVFPIQPGFGGANFKYFLFSKGEPIEVIDPNVQTAIRSEEQENRQSTTSAPDPRDRRRREQLPAATPVEVSKKVYPDYPEELQGTGVSGSAKIIFTIGVDGNVTEIIDMAADHRAFLGETRRAVLESEYTPAYYQSEPLPSSVLQNFSFNELVVFPGSLQMIPYPEIGDRPPKFLFSPDVDSGNIGGRAIVEVLIDSLGKARNFRVLESTSDELAEDLRAQSVNWVFLPAVEGGYPTEKRVRIPIDIGKTAPSANE